MTLHKSGSRLRRTRQRQAIASAFARTNRPLKAQEVLALAQAEVGEIGIATVYRQLNLLLSMGQLSALELPGQPLHYELTDRGIHHHFVCRACGRVYPVEARLESIQSMNPAGFILERCAVILYGRCRDCTGSPEVW